MNKGGIKILLAVVVLGILLMTFFMVQNKNATESAKEEKNAATSESAEYVLDSSVQNATFAAFSYVSASGKEVRLERKGGDWYYSDDESMVIDSEEISKLLSTFVTMEVKRKITEPEELSEYGLENPSNVLTYETEDGNKGRILFGDINATTKDLYVMIEGKNTVYTVDSKLADTFSVEAQSLALKTESE